MTSSPSDGSRRMSSWSVWGLNFLLWTFIACLQAVQNYTAMISEGEPADLVRSLLLQLSTYYPWAAFSPLLFSLVRRYPLDRVLSVRTLVLLPSIAVVCVTLQIAVHTIGMLVFPSPNWHPSGFWSVFGNMMRWLSFQSVLTFAAIIGVCQAIHYYRSMKEREVEAQRLERELTEARLNALQTQLQPHFFFNTLHSIASLVRDDQGRAAVDMIARLSDLFRFTLEKTQTQKIPLDDEVTFLNGLLEIERTRFSDRLRVSIDIAPEVRDALVPPLFLQPIVENAIKHGISRRPEAGTIQVSIRAVHDTLVATVTNDGVGIRADQSRGPGEGVGLRATKRRLEEMYGARATFSLLEAGEGRVRCEITIPLEKPASR